jgi:Fe-S cluster biogenesis protein NfuA
MIVIVEATPNPRTRKFLPGRHLSSIPREFNRDKPMADVLVQAIFALPVVKSVLVSEDAISVTVDDEEAWEDAVPAIRGTVSAMLSSDFLSDASGSIPEAPADFDQTDAVTVETIRGLIDTRIRPAVAADGGDIVFRSYRDGTLGLEMRGACSGCPSAAATLQHGIQNLMRHLVPQVTRIVTV